MRIVLYHKDQYQAWNSFVEGARNSHFFFKRDYMEYHSDRFDDHSLMVYDSKDKLIAILPANRRDNTLYSHQGLTFGGFLINDSVKAESFLEMFELLKNFLKEQGICSLVYKCMPYIYHVKPSSEEEYALFRSDAKLIRRDISSTINLKHKIKYQEQRKRAVKKAIKNGLVVENSFDFEAYWQILEETLRAQHDTSPVHSVEEMKMLASKFPENIKLYLAKQDEKVLGGTLVFENEETVHTQYLANSLEGRNLGALDIVIDHLINEVYSYKHYFDFGISTEEAGRYLNSGLIAQKEGFGARAIVHDFYELEIK